jgi:hypothetical protein
MIAPRRKARRKFYVWMVYDNQFGNVRSHWFEEAAARKDAEIANEQSKQIFEGRYFFIVRKEEVE